MDYKEMLAKARKLLEDAQAVYADPEAGAEDVERAEKMAEEGKALRTKASKLMEIAEAGASLAEMQAAVESKDAEVAAQAAAEQKAAEEAKAKGASPAEFKEWVEYLVACARAGMRDPTARYLDPRLVRVKEEAKGGHETKQMVESVGASGGFLVPPQFLAELQAALAENTIVRSRATIIRMTSRTVTLPVLDQTGTTADQAHWFGGMIGYWQEEATEKTLTAPEFRKVELVAHKYIMYTRASDELLDDSAISLADFLAGPVGFAGAIAWNEDYSFLRGSGAGQPRGILNSACRAIVARAGANAIAYADLTNMLEEFLPSGKGIWVCTQTGMSNLLQIVDPNGNYVWQPNAREGVPQTVFGFPIIFSEKLPAVGTEGDIMLADFSYYLVGDRQSTSIESTQYDQWALDQTSWRAVHRVDGQPWLSAPLTLADGTAQISPFVVLGGTTS